MDAVAMGPATEWATTTGRVTATTGQEVRVWSEETGSVEARRAVGCLVAPESGDLVLLVQNGAAQAYVLSVLERPGAGPLRLTAEGDLTVELPAGRFGVSAATGVEVTTGTAVLAADTLEVRAATASLLAGGVRLVADAVESVVERVSQSARQVFRRVTELDRLRAGQIDHGAEGVARLHGQHTLITARELVKADGKQIHIG
jgi:hypothetical protein